jgi:hypothetical protein
MHVLNSVRFSASSCAWLNVDTAISDHGYGYKIFHCTTTLVS